MLIKFLQIRKSLFSKHVDLCMCKINISILDKKIIILKTYIQICGVDHFNERAKTLSLKCSIELSENANS
jgi:hypothetical protein